MRENAGVESCIALVLRIVKGVKKCIAPKQTDKTE